jgi:hypothetical protein
MVVLADKCSAVEYTCPSLIANRPVVHRSMDNINPYESPQLGELVDERHPPAVPVTLADTLRLATSLYLAHLMPIAAITLLFWLPMELTESYLNYFVFDSEDAGKSFQLSMLFQLVIGLIPDAAIMAICLAALKGLQPTILAALGDGFAAWPRMFATRLAVVASVLLAMVLFVIPGIYVGVRTLLAEPAALAEDRGGMSAPGRSFVLTQGRFWRMFVLFCIVLGYSLGLGAISQIPFFFFDHWLLFAAVNVVIDLLSAWLTAVVFTAYWSLAHAPEYS